MKVSTKQHQITSNAGITQFNNTNYILQDFSILDILRYKRRSDFV